MFIKLAFLALFQIVSGYDNEVCPLEEKDYSDVNGSLDDPFYVFTKY